jgi:hypothetical protein
MGPVLKQGGILPSMVIVDGVFGIRACKRKPIFSTNI